MAQNVTTAEFQTEVLESETPVIVDFWADWCMPCHMVSPVLDEIAQERAGDLRLVKVDVDEEEELARRYGIVSIPTIILFKDGQPVAATIGARPKAAIEQQLGLTD